MSWSVAKAKDNLSEVIRRSRTDGPQEISLHGERCACGCEIPGQISELGCPVHTENANSGGSLREMMRRRSLRVENDRKISGESRHDSPNPLQRSGFVIVSSDDAAPGIKDLNRICAGANLHLEIRNQ